MRTLNFWNIWHEYRNLYTLSDLFTSIIIMRKFFVVILYTLSLFLIPFNQTNSISVADFTPALDKKVANMKTTEEKVNFLKSFSNLLTSPRLKQDKNSLLFSNLNEYSLNMLKVFEHQLKEEQSNSLSNNLSSTSDTIIWSTINLPHLSDNFSNIDEWKVRNAILSRHNTERQSLWRNPYVYNLDLEWSATTRANKIASSHKTSNLHLRNSWDWFYNYNSMLNWFSSLWIKFPKSSNWLSSFSESILYNTYRCTKSDCTEDLINAIKKTWTGLIMKEKSSNGSHYKAATMKHFTQMWAWIAIDKSNNRYYIVLHYWVNFN